MHTLNTLLFLSSTLATIPPTTPSKALPCPPTLPSSLPTFAPATPVKTVLITITHTLPFPHSPAPSTSMPTALPTSHTQPGLNAPLSALLSTLAVANETRLPVFRLEAGYTETSAVSGTHTRTSVRVSGAPGVSMVGFEWPGTRAGFAPLRAGETLRPGGGGDGKEDDEEGTGDENAWAGMDNAIPAQMQGRAVLDVGIVERYNDREGREERQCQPCEKEGEIACRGDVAVGMCKGGCVELRFLGRGKGNGCED